MPRWLDEMTNAGEPVIPKLVQDEVWERDEGQCVKCGTKKDVAVHCIVPYGMPTEANCQLLCAPCRRLL
jgi:5-methylcytosine-specific restriction endonuclease McrA